MKKIFIVLFFACMTLTAGAAGVSFTAQAPPRVEQGKSQIICTRFFMMILTMRLLKISIVKITTFIWELVPVCVTETFMDAITTGFTTKM